MSEKERDLARDGNQTEEPVQNPTDDDFEAHRDMARDAARDIDAADDERHRHGRHSES